VCDASVIPGPWGLPPTLTLLALGKRLGGELVRSA
jgi:choline dehydrogenase-like flavoprotein